jgi:predicted nucleic acid-binding protein
MILLDTDVILDVALDRAPHAEASSALLDHIQRHPSVGAFVAWHTLSNLYYLLRPASGSGDARDFLQGLTTFALVAPTHTDDLRLATGFPMPDLEDAMQAAAALACGARYIATRNTKDFERSPVPARTPQQLLELLGNTAAH